MPAQLKSIIGLPSMLAFYGMNHNLSKVFKDMVLHVTSVTALTITAVVSTLSYVHGNEEQKTRSSHPPNKYKC